MRRPWLWVVPAVVIVAALVGVAIASVGSGKVDDPPAMRTASGSPSPGESTPSLSAELPFCTSGQLQGTIVYRPSVASPSFQYGADGKPAAEQFPFELEIVNMSKADCVMVATPTIEWRRSAAAHPAVVAALADDPGSAVLPAGAGVFAAAVVGVPARCETEHVADDGTLALDVVQGAAPLTIQLHRLAECAASGPMVVWPFTPELSAADAQLRDAGWGVDPRGSGTVG